jgi:hypothetical protein
MAFDLALVSVCVEYKNGFLSFQNRCDFRDSNLSSFRDGQVVRDTTARFRGTERRRALSKFGKSRICWDRNGRLVS